MVASNPRIIVRVPANMAWSQESIDAINQSGMVFSRRSEFNGYDTYIVVNHGSHEPIQFGRKVKTAIVLNNPADVKLSVNKNLMYNHAAEKGIKNIPKTFSMPGGKGFVEAIDQIGLPLILKPNVGHGGEGCVVIEKSSQLVSNVFKTTRDYVAQAYIPKTQEYRFNFLNKEVVNVSRKILPDEAAKFPGIFDGWVSLGKATNLHERAHKLAQSIAEAFPLPSLAVDLMRVDKDLASKDGIRYYFGEVNSGYGLGPMTAERLKAAIVEQYNAEKLNVYKVI